MHGIRSWALCSKRNHFAEESGSLFRSPGSRDHVQPRRKDFVSFEHAKAAKVSKDHVSWCHMEISIWKKWWMLGEAEHEGWKMLEISDSTDDSNRGHLLEGLDVAAESYPQEYSGQVVWVTWIGKSVRQIQFWCNAGHYLSVSTVSYSKFAILIVWYCLYNTQIPPGFMHDLQCCVFCAALLLARLVHVKKLLKIEASCIRSRRWAWGARGAHWSQQAQGQERNMFAAVLHFVIASPAFQMPNGAGCWPQSRQRPRIEIWRSHSLCRIDVQSLMRNIMKHQLAKTWWHGDM